MYVKTGGMNKKYIKNKKNNHKIGGCIEKNIFLHRNYLLT